MNKRLPRSNSVHDTRFVIEPGIALHPESWSLKSIACLQQLLLKVSGRGCHKTLQKRYWVKHKNNILDLSKPHLFKGLYLTMPQGKPNNCKSEILLQERNSFGRF